MNSQPDTTDIIVRVCSCLSKDDTEGARQIILSECPIGPKPIVRDLKLLHPEHDHPKEEWDKGQPTPNVATKVFLQDGFIDRYTGNRLVFPGTLLLLSRLIPEVFPYDSAWRSLKGHQLYWDLFATVDHVYPKSRGGGGGTNFLTTSMNMNKSKGDHTPEEVDLVILPPGNKDDWDGLTHWFISSMDSHHELKKIPKEEPEQSVKIKALMKWYGAVIREFSK